jgi:GT2 family glycosyltransferase
VTGVAIVILNWNNWIDTMECLESIFRIGYPDFRVIVVDNGSTDGSVDRIREWAEGSHVSLPEKAGSICPDDAPVTKHVQYVVRDVAAVGEGIVETPPLLIIRSGTNLGFAGGNNVALRYLLKHDDWRYVWLLNNDTVVDTDALTALVRHMEESPRAGMCGSLLPYYDKPDIIWAQGGGTYNRWLARSGCIGNGLPLAKGFARHEVEGLMKYVAGASILVSREFIEEIGLMCEDYFLYFEEPDWAFRGRHRFGLAYAPESIVYHKVGMSTKKGSEPGTEIDRPEDYIFRNSLKFTRKFFPFSLPFVFVRVAFNRLRAWFGSLILRKRSGFCG